MYSAGGILIRGRYIAFVFGFNECPSSLAFFVLNPLCSGPPMYTFLKNSISLSLAQFKTDAVRARMARVGTFTIIDVSGGVGFFGPV
jgi:hypothetical protein